MPLGFHCACECLSGGASRAEDHRDDLQQQYLAAMLNLGKSGLSDRNEA